MVAGFPPIDLMVAEKCFLFAVGEALRGNKNMARRRTLRNGQERWDRKDQSASWTRRLIREMEPWIECDHKTTGYYFTQFLTGHGSYGTFTKRIGKTQNDQYHTCHSKDDPEHMFLYCSSWVEKRSALERSIGSLPFIEERISMMIADKRVWKEMYGFVNDDEKEGNRR